MIGSGDYWKGYSDAQKQSERNWERAKIEMNSRFIDILEDSKKVKGIGPTLHQSLIEYAMGKMMVEPQVEETISNNERSRIKKELANVKWSEMSDSQLIKFQKFLSLN